MKGADHNAFRWQRTPTSTRVVCWALRAVEISLTQMGERDDAISDAVRVTRIAAPNPRFTMTARDGKVTRSPLILASVLHLPHI